MVLKLRCGKNIELPNDFTTDERLKLVNEILAEYPHEFEYGEPTSETRFGMKQDVDMLVKIKLDILGTYIIAGDMEVNSKEIMSRYKVTKRPLQEMSFSQFNEDMVDMKGWH